MLLLLFGVWTWPFWVLLLTFFVAETILVESDKERLAAGTFLAILFVVALGLFTDVHLIQVPFSEILLCIIGYALIGGIYAFLFRFWIYVGDRCEAFKPKLLVLKKEWDDAIKAAGSNLDPEGLTPAGSFKKYKTFKDYLRGEKNMPPMPWDYGVKGKVYHWWLFWPCSMFWQALHRPFEIMWRTAKETMEKISYSTFKHYFPELG